MIAEKLIAQMSHLDINKLRKRIDEPEPKRVEFRCRDTEMAWDAYHRSHEINASKGDGLNKKERSGGGLLELINRDSKIESYKKIVAQPTTSTMPKVDLMGKKLTVEEVRALMAKMQSGRNPSDGKIMMDKAMEGFRGMAKTAGKELRALMDETICPMCGNQGKDCSCMPISPITKVLDTIAEKEGL